MRMQLILGEALTGLRRNASMVISVVLVTFVSLTFVGAAMLMQMQIGKMRDYWSERAQVSVIMCREDSTATTCADGAATQEQIDQVSQRLSSSALSGVVRDVRFESSDEAYQNLLKLYGDEYKDYVTPAQLGNTYFVGLIDPEKADVITEAFNGMAGVEEVKNQLQYLEPLFSALTIATYIAVGIAVLMLIAAVLLIATTIRLSAYARRREVGIMRLVGASNRFIQTPFILEGVFAAFIGSLMAGAAIVVGVHFGVGQYLKGRVSFITDWIDMGDAAIVIPVIVVIGLVLAALSASFAIRRWLRA
ncbi:cell division transport system permease protein [Microbacterium laevaniformans]|uniref:permease-like cell division protein FtsX n=1 Tax=Microbacterium TaxID=33882 RepID=UPI0004B8717A|nr:MULTISPECIES: permease-like cell division protein FtsX [Microbacterium]MBM7752775.1 cell division transport system permease protein [Microbacterium laevaniformans]ODT25139.1 MAG: cell division protein FtsX [Microbacterium sp. SCN 69-37]